MESGGSGGPLAFAAHAPLVTRLGSMCSKSVGAQNGCYAMVMGFCVGARYLTERLDAALDLEYLGKSVGKQLRSQHTSSIMNVYVL